MISDEPTTIISIIEDIGWSVHADAGDLFAQLDACIDGPTPTFKYDVDSFSFPRLAARYAELLNTSH